MNHPKSMFQLSGVHYIGSEQCTLSISGYLYRKAPHTEALHPEPHGWLSKLWSLVGVLIIIRHLIFRVPKKGP